MRQCEGPNELGAPCGSADVTSTAGRLVEAASSGTGFELFRIYLCGRCAQRYRTKGAKWWTVVDGTGDGVDAVLEVMLS